MIQGALLAYLLIRLSGVDREVMEKWLYVIVGLTFISGILGTAHHYYCVGVPQYWLPIGGFFRALEPLVVPRPWRPTPTRRSAAPGWRTRTRWPCTGRSGSAIFSALGAGLLGLAHTWPAVNRWTHGTLITPMHGHAAFFGAYVMIVLAVITYALPALTGHAESEREIEGRAVGVLAAGRRHVRHDDGVRRGGDRARRISSASSGFGYLETQAKIQVHFLMLVATGMLFIARRRAVPVGLLLPGAAGSARRADGGRRRRPWHDASDSRTATPSRPAIAPAIRRHAAALPGAGGAVLPAVGRRDRRLRDLPRARLAGDAQGADRLRQDALRRAHGVAARAGRSSPSPATTISRPATSPAAI